MQRAGLGGLALEAQVRRAQRLGTFRQQRAWPVEARAGRRAALADASRTDPGAGLRTGGGVRAQGFFAGSGLAPSSCAVGTACGGSSPQSLSPFGAAALSP